MTAQAILPEIYADLQPFVDQGWAAPERRDRTEKRLTSSMEEIRAFYDAVVPRLGEILRYLDGFALNDMPGEQQCLLNLCYGIAEIRNAVEAFDQPDVVDGWDTRRYMVETII